MADEIVEALVEEPTEEAPKPEGPTAADRLAALESKLGEVTSAHAQLQQNYNVLLANSLAGNKPQPIVEPDLIDVDEAEFEAAVQEGNGRKVAQLARRQAKIEAERAVRTLKADSVDPLRDMLGVGFEAVSAQAMEIARPNLKFLRRFEKEITETLKGLGPQQKISAEAIRHAHNLFVGANFDTLVEEEVERRQRARVGSPGGGPTPRRGATEAKVPQPEDLGGANAAREIQLHGGGDTFARKMGYESWDDYMEKTKEYRRAS